MCRKKFTVTMQYLRWALLPRLPRRWAAFWVFENVVQVKKCVGLGWVEVIAPMRKKCLLGPETRPVPAQKQSFLGTVCHWFYFNVCDYSFTLTFTAYAFPSTFISSLTNTCLASPVSQTHLRSWGCITTKHEPRTLQPWFSVTLHTLKEPGGT